SMPLSFSLFFFHAPTTTGLYTLSYTTLFRSYSVTRVGPERNSRSVWLMMSVFSEPKKLRRFVAAGGIERPPRCIRAIAGKTERRSEEHTSELQSPCNLVCRLLLEKKKTYNTIFSMFFLYSSPNDSKINLSSENSSITNQLLSCIIIFSNLTLFSKNCLYNYLYRSP